MFRQILRLRLELLAGLLLVADVSPLVAQMQYPLAVVGTEKGPLYVADRKLPGIWKIIDGKAEIYFQASKKFRTPLNAVRCLTFDKDGKLLAGDSATRDVYRFDDRAQPRPLTGGKIGIPITSGMIAKMVKGEEPLHHGKIGIPMSIAVDGEGVLFIADLETQRIWKVPAKGGEPEEFAILAGVRGLAFDSKGNLIVVTNLSDSVKRISPDGKIEVLVKGRPFEFPHQVAVGENDELYIADNYAGCIWKVPPGEKPVKFAQGKRLEKPVGIARIGKILYVADPHARQVFSLDAEGKITPVVK